MKTNTHPDNYRLVVFEDLNNNTKFLMKSTVATQETIKWEDGQTYPLVKLHVTSASHPYYTGLEKMIDVEGRIDKFKARQQRALETQAKSSPKPTTQTTKKSAKTKDKSANKTQAQSTTKEVKSASSEQ